MSLRVLPKTDELPRALYRAAQVRALDRVAISTYSIAGEVLMERAGQGAFNLLRKLWPEARDITVLAGTGNNGGRFPNPSASMPRARRWLRFSPPRM